MAEPLAPAVYARLAEAPSALLGVALDDLGGEVEPVNLPGVTGDVYPSWRRRMRLTLRQLAADALAKQTLAAVGKLRGSGMRGARGKRGKGNHDTGRR